MSRPKILRYWYGPLRVALHLPDDRRRGVLVEEFGVYEACPEDAGSADIEIVVDPPRPWEAPVASVGGDHDEYPDGFAAAVGRSYRVRWRLRDAAVRVEIRRRRHPLGLFRRWANPSFHSADEDIGKLIHEVALLGAAQMFRVRDLCFVHGASVVRPGGGAVILGGAGGVGKTSLALELAGRAGWAFLADDFTGLDGRGHVHLNAAPPKIYAYNVLGDRRLEKRLLRGRGPADRLHWTLLRRFPHRVRRTLPPQALFGQVASWAPLERLYLIVRTCGGELEVEAISASVAAYACARILRNELTFLDRHVSRSQYLRPLLRLEPLVSLWGVQDWARLLRERLERAACRVVRVPRLMDVRAYRAAMADHLEEEVLGADRASSPAGGS